MVDNLRQIAQSLTAAGRGILAADESTPTIGKRLARSGIDNTEENRRRYREIFFTAPGIGSSLSGCILFRETLYQASTNGNSFVSILGQAGILVGIKVDEGLEPLEHHKTESHTKGLEKLEENCREYARQGAKFSKWRAALSIKGDQPSREAIDTNAEELATYAAISQSCGLVPIVEPEILIEGTHSIQHSQEVASQVFSRVFESLGRKNVDLAACLLKIQMIMPGSEAEPALPQDIAKATIDTLSRSVPDSLAGIVFLSGGQSEEEATNNLNLIVNYATSTGQKTWGLSFSYGRSLQASVLEIWSNSQMSPEGQQKAQAMAVALAQANAEATLGKYKGPHPSTSSGPLREPFRGWNNVS